MWLYEIFKHKLKCDIDILKPITKTCLCLLHFAVILWFLM